MIRAIEDLAQRCRNQPNSYAIIYYSGHGISEGLTYTQLWAPGDVGVSAQDKPLDFVGRHYIQLSDVTDPFETRRIPLLVVSDACRNYRTADIQHLADGRLRTVLSDASSAQLGGIQDATRAANIYVGSNPTLVSAAIPGLTAVIAPGIDSPLLMLPPLARRLLLFERKMRPQTPYGIQDVIGALTDPKFDLKTVPGFTGFRPTRPMPNFQMKRGRIPRR